MALLGRSGGMPVLMLHGLHDSVPEYALYSGGRTCLLSVDDFKGLMRWCADHYDLIRLHDLDRVASGDWSGRPPMLLTFDDGLASVVDLAVPVLRDLGASAVVFVSTDWTDTGRTPDIFGLERVVSDRIPLHLAVTVGDHRFRSKISSRAGARRTLAKLWSFLFAHRFPPHALRDENVLLDGMPWEGRHTHQDRHFWYPATWNELSAGVSDGVLEIGSHMLAHEPLTWLSEEEQRRQLERSQSRLCEVFGQPVTACSYPHGFVDDRTEARAREVYRWSFTTKRGRVDSRTRRGAVPRYHVPGEGPHLVMRELTYGRGARWLARLGL